MNRLTPSCAALVLAACSTFAPPPPPVDPFAEARSQLAVDPTTADFDGALVQLDAMAAEYRESATYQALCGELTLRLALQRRDTGRKGAEFLLEDAAAALRRAIGLDDQPTAPRRLLVETLLAQNQYEAAANAADDLLRHSQATGAAPAELAGVHALRARAAASAQAAKRQSQEDASDRLEQARDSLRALEHEGQLDAELLSLWSFTEQAAGAPVEAVAVYVRAVQRQPNDQVLLTAMVDVAARLRQPTLALEALQSRRDAIGLWYLGCLRYRIADLERDQQHPLEAIASVDAAMQCFTTAMQLDPTCRDSGDQWLAMCLGKKGNIAFLAGDLPHAEAWLLASTRLRPDRIEADLGRSETTKLGLLRVGDRYMRDFAKTETFFRAALESASSDLDLLNNAAVYARDLGVRLERKGELATARDCFERSYATYQRAVRIDPSSVRLRNDTALIAIHHLDRDWDQSRQLLDAAIADGERTLRSEPPATAQARQDLEEAVGDCYENLALWHLVHSRDAAAAAAAANHSLRYFPGEQRPGARRHLEAAQRLRPGSLP